MNAEQRLEKLEAELARAKRTGVCVGVLLLAGTALNGLLLALAWVGVAGSGLGPDIPALGLNHPVSRIRAHEVSVR